MSELKFNAKSGLIIIQGRITGTKGEAFIDLVLDTGASSVIINSAVLEEIGYDLSKEKNELEVTTGKGIVKAKHVQVKALEVFEFEKKNTLVVSYKFPTQIKRDGFIGLTFLRNHNICLKFKNGIISFE